MVSLKLNLAFVGSCDSLLLGRLGQAQNHCSTSRYFYAWMHGQLSTYQVRSTYIHNMVAYARAHVSGLYKHSLKQVLIVHKTNKTFYAMFIHTRLKLTCSVYSH